MGSGCHWKDGMVVNGEMVPEGRRLMQYETALANRTVQLLKGQV
jgi:hypothetical protein